jgi:hypothetical protein
LNRTNLPFNLSSTSDVAFTSLNTPQPDSSYIYTSPISSPHKSAGGGGSIVSLDMDNITNVNDLKSKEREKYDSLLQKNKEVIIFFFFYLFYLFI